MDWQQPVALSIVAMTAALFLRPKFRPRKFSFARDTHCGCSPATQSAPKSSIIFRARKGGQREVIVKMR